MGQQLSSSGFTTSLREGLFQEYRRPAQPLALRIRPILRHANLILNTPEYFYCLMPGAYLSATFLQESGPLPLGILLHLWMQQQWLEVCLRCNKQVYIIGVADGDLLRDAYWWGICPSCTVAPHDQGKVFLESGVQNMAIVDGVLYTREHHYAKIGQDSSSGDCEQEFIQDLCRSAYSLLKAYNNRPIIPVPKNLSDTTKFSQNREDCRIGFIEPTIPFPFELLVEALQ